MPVTKITVSTAMRARDVSRPHEEHLAEAAAREGPPARRQETASPKPAPHVGKGATAASGPAPARIPAPPRRRRRRRS